jgi:hypothetical protein
MTSQGNALGRFTRAIKQGNLFAAELAASASYAASRCTMPSTLSR